MTSWSMGLRVLVMVSVLLVGAGALVITLDLQSESSSVATRSSSTASAMASSAYTSESGPSSRSTTQGTSSSVSIQSSTASGSSSKLTISSPGSGDQIWAGNQFTVSGEITPRPALPDNVTISVVYQGATFLSASASVQPDGSFSYLALCGSDWSMGYYTVVAIDAYGSMGNVTFEVMM